jgi:ABC-type amino acid transport substrate-binding protein
VANVVGYSVFGDYSTPAPLAGPVRAVDDGSVDVAVVWGPVASYFARRAEHLLTVAALAAGNDAGIAERFAMGVGVRRDDEALRRKLDEVLARRSADVRRVLAEYGLEAGRMPR